MANQTLNQQYPWLDRTNTVEDYLPPEYYAHLLHPYTFGGVSDLDLLARFLKNKNAVDVLELGCGSGRASDTAVGIFPRASYTFSDLSERMLASAKKYLPRNSSFITSDAVEFMEHATSQYDLVYTLWSFSHSTHQHIHRLGIEQGAQYINDVVTKFVTKNIRKGGSFFLIHFNSLSDEQRILMRQWQRIFPAFKNIERESPSKQIMDKTLLELDNQGVISLSIEHLSGDPITYQLEDVLLETFMNFHLETYFNTLPIVRDVIDDIKIRVQSIAAKTAHTLSLQDATCILLLKTSETCMKKLTKLQKGDKVAVLSPSMGTPGIFPHVFELGLQRIRNVFGLEPVEYPTTRKFGSTAEDRAKDLIAAFENPEIKAVIASIGGDDQITYVYDLPTAPFVNNPKPFFGYSDNSHFCNFLFLHDIPSFYGACEMTQFAMQKKMDDYTVDYIQKALFETGEVELVASQEYNEIGLDWNDKSLLTVSRMYEPNSGWEWDVSKDAQGVLWGGCLESLDDMLRNNVPIPTLDQFSNIVLLLETSGETPTHAYVQRVVRALGERGVLEKLQGVLVGRAKAWEFDHPYSKDERNTYVAEQQRTILETVRAYSTDVPIVQNINFGHTDPQIPMPYGSTLRIESITRRMFATF